MNCLNASPIYRPSKHIESNFLLNQMNKKQFSWNDNHTGQREGSPVCKEELNSRKQIKIWFIKENEKFNKCDDYIAMKQTDDLYLNILNDKNKKSYPLEWSSGRIKINTKQIKSLSKNISQNNWLYRKPKILNTNIQMKNINITDNKLGCFKSDSKDEEFESGTIDEFFNANDIDENIEKANSSNNMPTKNVFEILDKVPWYNQIEGKTNAGKTKNYKKIKPNSIELQEQKDNKICNNTTVSTVNTMNNGNKEQLENTNNMSDQSNQATGDSVAKNKFENIIKKNIKVAIKRSKNMNYDSIDSQFKVTQRELWNTPIIDKYIESHHVESMNVKEKLFEEEQYSQSDDSEIIDDNINMSNTKSILYFQAVTKPHEYANLSNVINDSSILHDSNSENEEKKKIPIFPSTKLNSISLNNNAKTRVSEQEKQAKDDEDTKKILFNSVVSYLDNPEDVLSLSLANKTWRNIIRPKWSKILIQSIITINLQKALTENTLKFKKLIFKNSQLSLNMNLLQRIYYDHLFLPSKHGDKIQKDLSRTLPNNPDFKWGSDNGKKLFNIWTAYSNYNQTIGYTQGLNFIVAQSIILFPIEEECFLFIDSLIHTFQLEDWFSVNDIFYKKLNIWGDFIQNYATELAEYLDTWELNHDFFTTNWIWTWFSNAMTSCYLFIVWDLMIVYGWDFFNFYIVTVLKRYTHWIKKNGFNELSNTMKMIMKMKDFEADFEEIIIETVQMMEENKWLV